MKFHWGHGITLVIVSFMAMILYFVFDSFNYQSELVAPDYYAKEVAYQEQIEKMKNAQHVQLETKYTKAGLLIEYPQNAIQGKLHFFRPSDKNLDFEVVINPDSLGTQLIDPTQLAMGFWRIKAEWKHQDKSFYSETSFVAP
ncbi:MAG: FixH family protein [Flammeovirgaceae bacterium]